MMLDTKVRSMAKSTESQNKVKVRKKRRKEN